MLRKSNILDLSEYNELHLLYILGLSYLYLNIYHYYNNNKNISISIIAKKMHPSAIESYYNKLKPIENISDNESDSDIEELIDSALTPNAPVIIDNKFDECINVKMYCDNINIIENYIENNEENYIENNVENNVENNEENYIENKKNL